MPSFHVKTPHSLGKELAVNRLKHFAEHVAAHYKDQVSRIENTWEDDKLNFSITAYGFTFSGVVKIEETEAILDGTLPFAALPFRGRIESGFAQELQKALK